MSLFSKITNSLSNISNYSPSALGVMDSIIGDFNSFKGAYDSNKTLVNAQREQLDLQPLSKDDEQDDIDKILENYFNSWQTSATKLQKDYIEDMKTYNSEQARIAYERSQTSADKQMDFQREMFDKQTAYNTLMSNTQYQRAVADLKAAGINPILAVGGLSGSVPSASVGSGASTQASAPTIGQANFANSLSVDRDLGSALSGMLTSAAKLVKAFF